MIQEAAFTSFALYDLFHLQTQLTNND